MTQPFNTLTNELPQPRWHTIEGRELGVFLVCALVVLATWLVIGFNPADSLMSHDGIWQLIPVYTILEHVHGDLAAMTYRWEQFGGVNVLGTVGILPVSIALAKLGVPALWNENLSVLFTQVCMAYLGVRAVALISQQPVSRRFTGGALLEITCVTFLIAFAPILVWRIQQGHLNLIVALAAIQAFIALWLCYVRGVRSLFFLFVALLTLTQGLCLQGFQLLVYAATFCLPLLAGAYHDNVKQPGSRIGLGSVVFCCMSVVIAILLAAPIFIEMFSFALSSDAPRTPGAHTIVYSYLVSNWQDWWTSITWINFGNAGRAEYELHEVFYAIGPSLALILPLLILRKYWTVTGLAISLALGFVFSANVTPFSTWINHGIPILQSFRVPARVVMPLILIWNTFAIGWLLGKLRSLHTRTNQRLDFSVAAGFLVAALAVYLLPAALQEFITWVSLACLLFSLVRDYVRLAIPTAIIVSIMCVNASAKRVHFEEGLLPQLAQMHLLANRIIKLDSRLASPLYRLDANRSKVGLFVIAGGGVSTLNGQGFPSRHYSEIIQRLASNEFDPARANFNMTLGILGFSVTQQLYNVVSHLVYQQGKPLLQPLPVTPGPVWASSRRETVSSSPAMVTRLKQLVGQPHWHGTQLGANDTAARAFNDHCGNTRFTTPVFRAHETKIEFEVAGGALGAACATTLSLGYAHNLAAHAITQDGQHITLATYPAYGMLEGFVLPANTVHVVISAKPDWPRLSFWMLIIGLLAAAVLGLFWYRRTPTPGPQ